MLDDSAVRDADKHVLFSTPDPSVLEPTVLIARRCDALGSKVLRGCPECLAWELFHKGRRPCAREGAEVHSGAGISWYCERKGRDDRSRWWRGVEEHPLAFDTNRCLIGARTETCTSGAQLCGGVHNGLMKLLGPNGMHFPCRNTALAGRFSKGIPYGYEEASGACAELCRTYSHRIAEAVPNTAALGGEV